MEVGDTLLVPKELMTFRKAYQYVKSQQDYAAGRLFVVERDPEGWIVRRTDDPDDISGKQYLKRPGQPGVPCDWGLLQKQGREFRWPLGNMELGDIFWVLPEQLPRDKVAARVYNVSTQTGFKFNISENEETGMFRIQRVTERGVGWECVKYGIVRARVRQNYRTDDKSMAPDWQIDDWTLLLDMIEWDNLLEEGQEIFVPAELLDELPERTSYVFEGTARDGDHARFALDMEPDGVRVTRIAFDVTQQIWDAKRSSLEVDPFS